ncbi:MAG: ChaN family lipoprotein [Candidatus Kapabacteria bacterium]|nr:ChaN family lipoprotein [Ignavibacteriota bacterium]MCW5883926.1 ChaN family lipoprotein [Candidatus Kapabacteria bacterium]
MKSYLILLLAGILSVFNIQANDNYIIYDTKSSKKVNLEDMVIKTLEADVIFFGEFHDDSLNHFLQADYLKKSFKQNKNITVSMEMFERDVQIHIDEYFAGSTDEEEFMKNSRPWPDYKKFYREIVETAKSNNSYLIAANIPRKYASQYVSGGMTSFKELPAEERSYISRKMVLAEDGYLDKFLETMTGSKEMVKSLNSNKENTLYLYYGAQCIKDETMAESIADYLKQNSGRKVIHFNGDFHSNSYLGTASMLQRRMPELKISVITPIYYESIDSIDYNADLASFGDFVIFLPQFERPQMPMMSGGTSHFGENYATEHNINVEIDPAKSFLKGSDKIKFKNPILKSSSLKLINSLEVTKMSSKDNNLKFSIRKADDFYNEILIENLSLKNQSYDNDGIIESFEVEIEYQGIVNFPPSETNMVKRHSNTPGIISGKDGEGIYLPGGAYYPQADKDLAKFTVYVNLPLEYKLVTSGEIEENPGSKNMIYKITSEMPIDEMILVAAKYKIMEEDYDGVRFALYYFNDAPHNLKYILSSKSYYDEYTKLFGKYPYKSFIIAENFFPTGFGMPGYTLLSSRLTAMPWVTLSPGSLAHEFVHNWWGNSVFTDNESGNWCEALTTFSTNYYFNIISGYDSDALDWRRKALIAIDALPEDKNYPVKDFKYQKTTFDAVVGYSKGAFIFEEIRKLIGDELFFKALKSFAEKNTGKRAYWMNLTSEFASVTKDTLQDLKIRKLINEWLNSTDIAEIRFADVPVFEGDSVEISISSSLGRVQSVPVIITYNAGGKYKDYLVLRDTINKFRFPVSSGISSVKLDPELETLRKINRWEKPFSFNQVLSSKPIVILPDKKSPDFKIAMDYVNILKSSGYDFEYYTYDNISADDLNYSSLILLGNVKNNKLIQEYAGQLPDNLKLDENGFLYNKKLVDFKEDILMANVEHLHNQDKFCNIIYFDGLSDVAPLNRLIHYQSYSLVLLSLKRTGRPSYSTEIYPKSADMSPLYWNNSMESTIRGTVD